jgi:hypothetical protein
MDPKCSTKGYEETPNNEEFTLPWGLADQKIGMTHIGINVFLMLLFSKRRIGRVSIEIGHLLCSFCTLYQLLSLNEPILRADRKKFFGGLAFRRREKMEGERRVSPVFLILRW